MKTPKLEEVKEHFKNAKQVKGIYSGDIFEIDFTKEFQIYEADIECLDVNGWRYSLYSDMKEKYAEIISYKSESEQIQPDPIPNDVLKIVEKYGVDKMITYFELIKK